MTIPETTTRSCTDCRLAQWRRTANSSLHLSGDGLCGWGMSEIVVPKSLYWGLPEPEGGYINRKSPFTDCPTWESNP